MKMYRIISTFLLLWFLTGISIAQKKTQNNPWFFIQITDPQFGMFTKNMGFEKETILYEKAVTSINKLNPEFVVITGDFVNNQNSESQINEFKRITAKISTKIPVYYSPGNHDVGQTPDKKSIRKFRKNYGKDKFSFHYKGSSFIGFNTSYIKANQQNTEQKQYKWLIKQLEKNQTADHIILFCHYPFFNKSFDEPEAYSNIGLEYREKYLSLFQSFEVDAIFSGHHHNNSHNNYNGIQLVTTSAVGKQLGDATSGMRIVKIYNDRVEHEYFGLDNIPESIKLK